MAHADSNVVTSDICASFDQNEITQKADEAHAITSDYLLSEGNFSRVVNGFAKLAIGVGASKLFGGGTNTNGAYFSYYLDASVLPDGVCDDIPTHSGDEMCSNSSVYENGETQSVMLGPSDAIVFYGCTPPPVEYFGYDFIITTRLTETYPFYPGTNFQDALSWRDVNVTDDSTSSKDIHQPFDRPALLIHTTSHSNKDIRSLCEPSGHRSELYFDSSVGQ